MTRDPACVFCKIVAVEIPAAVVYENSSVLAFLDVGPLAEGHLLVIPRAHYCEFADMPPRECAQLATALPSMARAVREVTGAEGYNILLNEGRAAGQVVPHVHFHIIPRFTNDELGYRWKSSQYASGRAEELTTALQGALTHDA